MRDLKGACRTAVVQASPVLFDRERTVEKAAGLILEAGKAGADLVLFPESFIPAYPRGFSYGFIVGSRTMEGRKDWKIYYDQSVPVPGEDTKRLGEAAREAGVWLCMGVTEREERSCTLYCTTLYFNPQGEIVGKHRKLKPTGTERLIWGDGHEGGIVTADTGFGTIGGLTCWENYMPLARAALYERGVGIYLAPTADNREEWQITVRHIALEGRCFVLGCNQYVTKSMYPDIFSKKSREELKAMPEELCPGGSCIIDPFGRYIAGPVWNREEMLIADLDLGLIALSRLDFDPAGHYARPDVLELTVRQ